MVNLSLETTQTALVYLEALTEFLPETPEDLEEVIRELDTVVSKLSGESCPHGVHWNSGISCGFCDGTASGLRNLP